MEAQKRSVDCSGGSVEYYLTRKNVKNINMRVKADGSVYVSASARVPVKYIEEFIRSRYDFILTSIKKLNPENGTRRSEPDLNAVHKEGDIFLFLGEKYRLKISYGAEDEVFTEGELLTVKTCDTENSAYITKLVRNWYYNRTVELFREIDSEVYAAFSMKYDIPAAKIRIRNMRSQWGSCHISDGIIVMNSRLIYYPRESVRYVFIHEYAHFFVPNHSPDFYRIVAGFMPDYKKWSDKLK